MQTPNNRAWLWVTPALLVVLFSSALPMLTVVNYSLQDVFAGDQFVWAGAMV